MAENLGKIDIGVTIERDTGGGSGGGAGGGGGGVGGGGGSSGGGGPGLGDIIRGFSKVAVVVGAFVVMHKVIGRLTKQIESTIDKFSTLNAAMALAAAQRKVAGIFRDIKSANILAGPMAGVSKGQISIADAMRPLMDVLALIKTFVVTLIQPVILSFVESIQGATLMVLNLGITFKSVGDALIDIITGILTMIPGMRWMKWGGVAAKGLYSEQFELLDKALQKLLEEMQRTNQDKEEFDMNQMMGSIGVQLTDNRWNPWQENAANGGSK